MKKMIEVNLSVEKSGGEEKLSLIINALRDKIIAKYPDADVVVRKGFFTTVDGITISEPDADINTDIRILLAKVRTEILG